MKMERRSPRAVCLFRRTERKKERANRFKRVQKNHNDQGSQKKRNARGHALGKRLLFCGFRQAVDVYPCLFQSPLLHLEWRERAYVELLVGET